MALLMRTAAMVAAVGKVSLLRTRVRAEAPSRSSASCSPSCSGLAAPASRRGCGEPRGEGFLVVAWVLGCGVLRVVDFDGRRDEGTQPGRGHLEGSEESFAG